MKSRLLRLLHFSPSTATERHDSHRAALGIGWFLQEAIRVHSLPHRWELVWALPTITDQARVHSALTGADLIVIGSPTYGQGSPWFVRKFFELTTGLALWAKPATAFATAGGNHTGGEQTVADTLRSLQGIGAATFSFAQKTMVFGTNQKFAPDGIFDFIDVWFMQQFARTLVLHLIARDAPDDAAAWAQKLGLDSGYYHFFPTETALQRDLGEIRHWLNRPLNDKSAAYDAWTERLGFDCHPPQSDILSFRPLLPSPTAPLAHSNQPSLLA